MKRVSAIIAAAVLAAAAWTGPALAWGGDGHRAVAYVAYSLLTPEVRQAVDTVLGDDGAQGRGAAFVAASTWPDEIRGIKKDQPYPQSGPWHYVSINLADDTYVQARDCKNRVCVAEKIGEFQARMIDPALPAEARRDALSFVVHFVGDIHQPLHATENNDLGGNLVKVMLNGRESKLHAVWDSGIVRASWGNVEAHRARLAERAPEKIYKWATGTPAEWATESHRIGRRFVHAGLPQPSQPGAALDLPADYAARMRPVIDAQVVKGGIRLAMLLNGAFSARR